jgi:YjbE family integral membrane protein
MGDADVADFHVAGMVSDTAQLYASPSSDRVNQFAVIGVVLKMSLEYLISILQIILIDVVLSGDNAVVIAMAAHKLPERQRKKAIFYGGGIAVLLRIVFTLVMAFLLMIPGVRLIGGLILAWIAIKLLTDEGDDHEFDAGGAERSAWAAVRMIFIADLVMSLDNMLAVAGASHGDWIRLLLGLIVSIGIIMTSSAVIARLMNRYRWIVYLGAAILAQTAGQMMLGDRELAGFIARTCDVCLSRHWETDYMLTRGEIHHFQSSDWPDEIRDYVRERGAGEFEFIGPMSAPQRDLLLDQVDRRPTDKKAIVEIFERSQAKWPKTIWDGARHLHFVSWIFYGIVVVFCLALPVWIRRRKAPGSENDNRGAPARPEPTSTQ